MVLMVLPQLCLLVIFMPDNLNTFSSPQINLSRMGPGELPLARSITTEQEKLLPGLLGYGKTASRTPGIWTKTSNRKAALIIPLDMECIHFWVIPTLSYYHQVNLPQIVKRLLYSHWKQNFNGMMHQECIGYSQACCEDNKVHVRALGLLEWWINQTLCDLIHTTDY